MTTYAEQVQPYINFESKDEMDKHFNLFRKKHRFDITEKENHVLFTLNGFARKFPGACKVEVEKIAKAACVSIATVKRAFTKADRFGMIKRFKTRKQNGRRQGVTVYQFQRFELDLEPQTASDRPNDEKPCESKLEGLNLKPYLLILLLPSLKKSFKDTNITDVPDKNKSLKIGLLNKVPKPIANAISPFMNDVNEIHEMVGTIFSAKAKVDKSIKIEAHENEFYKAIVSVFESQKRAARKEKAFNVFAVMYRAIEKLAKSIVNPEPKEAPEDTVKPLKTKELIQQWMIDNEKDPAYKAQLQATKDLQEQEAIADLITNSKEQLPDWFIKNKLNKATAAVPVEEVVEEINEEEERKNVLRKLGYSEEEILAAI